MRLRLNEYCVMRKKLDTGLLHAMQAFLRVVDSGSFSAAGHQMGLTTAQISRLVSDLEERLGIKLLQRTTRQRALTEAGQAYAERCREVIALVQDAEADASGATIRPRGRLRVQCMASFGQHYVAPALAGFCASHPELVVEYSASQYEPDLLARGADVSLYLAETLQNSGTVARRIGTTFAVLCASPAYLALHGEPGNPEQLHGYDCIRLVNPSITTEWRLTTGDGRVTPWSPKARSLRTRRNCWSRWPCAAAALPCCPCSRSSTKSAPASSKGLAAMALAGHWRVCALPDAPFHGCEDPGLAGVGGCGGGASGAGGRGVFSLRVVLGGGGAGPDAELKDCASCFPSGQGAQAIGPAA
ncbi:LysR family transcriptional regulator [Comamonas endophytica]|uniref:LysR family transcriptional regulator n=1 Tax=Comamonas endophytica TaxID=2949090 RepID=UPI003622E3A8